MLRRHVFFIMDLKIKTISFPALLHCLHIFGYFGHLLYKRKRLVFRKSACPFGLVKNIMYLPESPFFKNSLAGASGLVLMSVPAPLKLKRKQNIEKHEAEYVKCKNATNFYQLCADLG